MIIPEANTLVVREQKLSLLPQRAIFWHEENTLIVADVHLGKAQTFQRSGIPIPAHSFYHDLERLAQLIQQTRAKRLLVLGDFVHHRSGLTGEVVRAIHVWCESLASDTKSKTELIVVLGNHDKPNRSVLAELPLTLNEPVWQCGPFVFAHDDPGDSDKFRFLGHIHPVVNLPQMRLPVFAFYRDHAVLPAFSYFTGGALLRKQGARIYVPLEEVSEVMHLPSSSL